MITKDLPEKQIWRLHESSLAILNRVGVVNRNKSANTMIKN